MTTLDAHRYRDPLEVILADEARTCKGCTHEVRLWFHQQEFKRCSRHRRHGSRCKDYNPEEKAR